MQVSAQTDTANARRRGAAFDEALERLYEPVRGDLEEVGSALRALTHGQPSFIIELLDHVLETTGKRVRPAITLLASRFHPNDGANARTMASAVELLHVATLIHDDTVDDSAFRRGRATISSMWGNNAAVLVGDFVFAASATFVCDTGNIRVVRRFAETIMELSIGELGEMARAHDASLTREEYFRRIYKKTASLFTTAGESGAVLSGAPEDVVDALRSYGYNLGMAFQITDDVLDFEGASEETGKPVGSDLANGVLTLPAIIALERQPEDNPIAALCERPDDRESLRAAVDLIQQPSIIEAAYSVADDFSRKALRSLDRVPPARERDSLAELARYLVRRRG